MYGAGVIGVPPAEGHPVSVLILNFIVCPCAKLRVIIGDPCAFDIAAQPPLSGYTTVIPDHSQRPRARAEVKIHMIIRKLIHNGQQAAENGFVVYVHHNYVIDAGAGDLPEVASIMPEYRLQRSRGRHGILNLARDEVIADLYRRMLKLRKRRFVPVACLRAPDPKITGGAQRGEHFHVGSGRQAFSIRHLQGGCGKRYDVELHGGFDGPETALEMEPIRAHEARQRYISHSQSPLEENLTVHGPSAVKPTRFFWPHTATRSSFPVRLLSMD